LLQGIRYLLLAELLVLLPWTGLDTSVRGEGLEVVGEVCVVVEVRVVGEVRVVDQVLVVVAGLAILLAEETVIVCNLQRQ
jgi:hypothetical protein